MLHKWGKNYAFVSLKLTQDVFRNSFVLSAELFAFVWFQIKTNKENIDDIRSHGTVPPDVTDKLNKLDTRVGYSNSTRWTI